MSAQKIKTVIKPPEKTSTNILKQAPGPKNKGGRPPKAEAERLTKKLTCNFTAAEFKVLDGLSKESGLPVAVLIRIELKKAGVI